MAVLLDHRGNPFPPSAKLNGNGKAHRPELADAFLNLPRRRRQINAGYDAARTTEYLDNYWANADRYDADSSDSKSVRDTLVSRSRYEVGNNGYADGITQTHANFVVGIGPQLRMQTPDKAFNRQVEDAWWSWVKAVQYRRKLWCLCHAKTQDGEGFGVVRANPKLKHPVKLDLVLFETEQCQTPHLPFNAEGRIDGIHFDEFGNESFFDVLPYHPGGTWYPRMIQEPERIPADWVVHWFTLRRPGQHRAVPEFRSTLNLGAAARRWREATLAAAETAADYAVLLKTTMTPEGVADLAAPFSSTPIEKHMMTAMPMGWDASQLDAKHPNSTYDSFHRQQINEAARPKSIPQNIATCDSSGYNFASGKLDQSTYFLTVDVEREDANDLVNDKVFARWFELATLVYGWSAEPQTIPPHSWDWPKHPVGDIKAVAAANDTRLKNGSTSLSKVYTEAGEDFGEQVEIMAADYGVTVDEMRSILLKTNLPAGGAAPPLSLDEPGDPAETGEEPADGTLPKTAPAAATASGVNVAGSALNGSQITSLLEICDTAKRRPINAYSPDQERADDGKFGSGGGALTITNQGEKKKEPFEKASRERAARKLEKLVQSPPRLKLDKASIREEVRDAGGTDNLAEQLSEDEASDGGRGINGRSEYTSNFDSISSRVIDLAVDSSNENGDMDEDVVPNTGISLERGEAAEDYGARLVNHMYPRAATNARILAFAREYDATRQAGRGGEDNAAREKEDAEREAQRAERAARQRARSDQ